MQARIINPNDYDVSYATQAPSDLRNWSGKPAPSDLGFQESEVTLPQSEAGFRESPLLRPQSQPIVPEYDDKMKIETPKIAQKSEHLFRLSPSASTFLPVPRAFHNNVYFISKTFRTFAPANNMELCHSLREHILLSRASTG